LASPNPAILLRVDLLHTIKTSIHTFLLFLHHFSYCHQSLSGPIPEYQKKNKP
jgi:hypothetical protein